MNRYDIHADEQGFTLPRWTVKDYAAIPGDIIRHIIEYTDTDSEQSQFDLDCRRNAWLVADRLNSMQEKYRWLMRQSPRLRVADLERIFYGGQG